VVGVGRLKGSLVGTCRWAAAAAAAIETTPLEGADGENDGSTLTRDALRTGVGVTDQAGGTRLHCGVRASPSTTDGSLEAAIRRSTKGTLSSFSMARGEGGAGLWITVALQGDWHGVLTKGETDTPSRRMGLTEVG